MPAKFKYLIGIAISVLTGVVTVLMVIPGEQGESALQIVIEALQRIIA